MAEDKVFIKHISVENIGGLESFEADLGAVNLVTGANGEGKSSILNALNIVFAGGTDPALIRKGAEYGRVTLTLTDGTTISKKIESDGADVKIKTAEGGKVKREAEYLGTLAASYGFDPIGWLSADPKKRDEFLVKNLSVAFTAGEFNEALGIPLVTSTVSLEKFTEIRDGKYEERTELNRKVRDAEGNLSEMRKALPKSDGQDWSEEVNKLTDEIGKVNTSIATAEAEIKTEAKETFFSKQKEIQDEIVKLQKDLEEFRFQVQAAEADAIAEKTKALEATRAELSMQLGTAKSNAAQQEQAVGVKRAIATSEESLKGKISEEMRLTKAIKALDDLKYRKLKELPIDGFDLKMVKGKPQITIGGVSLDKINRQQAIFVGIQAVSLAAGRLPLILCEASELDDNSLKDLSAAAKDAGLQLVLARWRTDAPLAVEVS